MINDDNDGPHGGSSASVVRFPFSRVTPVQSHQDDEQVLYGALATLIGVPREQTTGHWCSRCCKIWYGYLLEVACPACGNRHG